MNEVGSKFKVLAPQSFINDNLEYKIRFKNIYEIGQIMQE